MFVTIGKAGSCEDEKIRPQGVWMSVAVTGALCQSWVDKEGLHHSRVSQAMADTLRGVLSHPTKDEGVPMLPSTQQFFCTSG